MQSDRETARQALLFGKCEAHRKADENEGDHGAECELNSPAPIEHRRSIRGAGLL